MPQILALKPKVCGICMVCMNSVASDRRRSACAGFVKKSSYKMEVDGRISCRRMSMKKSLCQRFGSLYEYYDTNHM